MAYSVVKQTPSLEKEKNYDEKLKCFSFFYFSRLTFCDNSNRFEAVEDTVNTLSLCYSRERVEDEEEEEEEGERRVRKRVMLG